MQETTKSKAFPAGINIQAWPLHNSHKEKACGIIQGCLRAEKQKTYHISIRGKMSRSTLARANITSEKVHEANIIDKLPIENGAIYIY